MARFLIIGFVKFLNMKIKILIVGLALASFNSFAQDKKAPTVGEVKAAATKTSNAEIAFVKDLHDFGTINKGDNGTFDFTFKNTGNDYKEWPFDQPFYLILNLAVGGNWGGKEGVDLSIWPQRMEVDYVRVYNQNPKEQP